MTGNDFINKAITGEQKWNSAPGLAIGDFFSKITPYWQDGWSGVDVSAARDLFLSNNAAIFYYGAAWWLSNIMDETMS
jgi:raffinose/stachyose/melibiose transport system substrate-binding protein